MSILKYVKPRRGQATTELALAFPLFALAFLAIVEFCHLFYVKLTLQHALHEAGRYMVTGQADVPDQSTSDPNDKLARPEAINAIFEKWLMGTGVGLQCLTMSPVQIANPPACSLDPGGPGDTVKLTAVFEKPFFSGVFRLFDPSFPISVTFSASTTWRNEGFT